MIFSLRRLVWLEPMILKGFEMKRDIGILKLATMEKVNVFGDWELRVREKFKDGCDEFGEQIHMDIDFLFHWEKGGRFWSQANASGVSQEAIGGIILKILLNVWYR